MEARREMKAEIGFDAITKSRLGNFILWQAVHPTVAYVVCRTLLSPLPLSTAAAVFDFVLFQMSSLLFSMPLFLQSSPRYVAGASPMKFLLCLAKRIFFNVRQPLPTVRLSYVVFLAFSGVSSSIGVALLCGSEIFGRVWLAGLVVGWIYGSNHKRRRWSSDLFNVEEPSLFVYNIDILKAVVEVSKLSSHAYPHMLSVLLPICIIASKGMAMRDLFMELTVFYCACFMLFICWELNHHLLQVIITKRLLFVPPIVDTNPIIYLLEPLERSITITHVRNLAYLDLCMVSESNAADNWRRDAIFEGTGEIFKRVIAICVTPLEQLIWDLNEFNRLIELHLRPDDPFSDMQVCVWCARIATAVTVHSTKLSLYATNRSWSSITDTISTLLAALIVVETFLDQSRNEEYDRKAHSMADVLRTSMYRIVSVFNQSMVAHSGQGQLHYFLISAGHPLYESRELLQQKLEMFLTFQAD